MFVNDNNYFVWPQIFNTSGVNVWLNIQLGGSFYIAAVLLISNCGNCNKKDISSTCIRVGFSATVNENLVCKDGLDNEGIFLCDLPLTGTHVGLIRESTWDGDYRWAEIRAYEFLPLTIQTKMLSTNSMPNKSLINSLSFSMAKSKD